MDQERGVGSIMDREEAGPPASQLPNTPSPMQDRCGRDLVRVPVPADGRCLWSVLYLALHPCELQAWMSTGRNRQGGMFWGGLET